MIHTGGIVNIRDEWPLTSKEIYEYSFNNDLAKQYYLSLWEEETIANQDLQQINEYDGQIKETFNLYGNESDISEEFNKTIFDLLDIIDK